MAEVLDVRPRRTLPAWAAPAAVVLAALAIAVWTVLALLPPTVAGHGSTPLPHIYQPLRGQLLI